MLLLPPRAISIHAAREGGDSCCFGYVLKYAAFQSTPPVKAATLYIVHRSSYANAFQSTPPVKAATPRHLAFLIRNGGISIHAAREGGDAEILVKIKHVHDFNPRRP